jgi:hypothetical protein
MKLTFGDMLKTSEQLDEAPPQHAHDAAGRMVVSPQRAVEGGGRQ